MGLASLGSCILTLRVITAGSSAPMAPPVQGREYRVATGGDDDPKEYYSSLCPAGFNPYWRQPKWHYQQGRWEERVHCAPVACSSLKILSGGSDRCASGMSGSLGSRGGSARLSAEPMALSLSAPLTSSLCRSYLQTIEGTFILEQFCQHHPLPGRCGSRPSRCL